MTTWNSEKDLGATSFSSQNYHDAIRHYSNAIQKLQDSGVQGVEVKKHRQILLSNVIACRLKIGGKEMIDKAVGEAKECIALNSSWAKGHVRLASAYIAQGGHSNDACQALQRAISLDKDNKVAREMLIKELRRRDCGTNSVRGSGRNESTSATGGSAQYTTDENTTTSQPASASSHNQSSTNTSNYADIDDIPAPQNPNTLSEQFQKYMTRAISWYHAQSDDKKTLIKVSFCFLLLYIALGGRFGLEYAVGQKKRGNYGAGNVYERYNRPQRAQTTENHDNRYSSRTTNSRDSSAYNDRSNPRNDQYYSQYNNNDHYGEGTQRRQQSRYSSSSGQYNERGSSHNDRRNPRNYQYHSRYNDDYDEYYETPRRQNSSFFGLPNLFDGSASSMAILFIIGSICHRFGINPFHLFMMLNMAQNRGRVRQRGGIYPGGFGRYGAGGGFRFGVGRNRFGRRY